MRLRGDKNGRSTPTEPLQRTRSLNTRRSTTLQQPETLNMSTRASPRTASLRDPSASQSTTSVGSPASSQGEATIAVGGLDFDSERPAKRARVSSVSGDSAVSQRQSASASHTSEPVLPDTEAAIVVAGPDQDSVPTVEDEIVGVDIPDAQDISEAANEEVSLSQPSMEQAPPKRKFPGGGRGRGGKRPKGWNLRRANKHLLANGRMPSLPPDDDLGTESHSPAKNQAGGILDRLPGRRRAPHADPLVEADMRRQLELKVAYRAVVKALKPLLIELAERTAKELDRDLELYKRYDEYDEIMAELDARLDQRLEMLKHELALHEGLAERTYQAAERGAKGDFEHIVEGNLDRIVDSCELDFLKTLRDYERQEDDEATDDEDEVVPRLYKPPTRHTDRQLLDPIYESRGRVGVMTERLWTDLEARYNFSKHHEAADKASFVRHPKGFAVYDGEVRKAATAGVNIGILLDASEELSTREQASARKAENSTAHGLQVLADASQMAFMKEEQTGQQGAHAKPPTMLMQPEPAPTHPTGQIHGNVYGSPFHRHTGNDLVKHEIADRNHYGTPRYDQQHEAYNQAPPPSHLRQPHAIAGYGFQSYSNGPVQSPRMSADAQAVRPTYQHYDPARGRVLDPPFQESPSYASRPWNAGYHAYDSGARHDHPHQLPQPLPQYGQYQQHEAPRQTLAPYQPNAQWAPQYQMGPPPPLPRNEHSQQSVSSVPDTPKSPSARVKSEDPTSPNSRHPGHRRSRGSSSGSKRGSRDNNVLPPLAPAQAGSTSTRPLQPSQPPQQPTYLHPPNFIQPHALPNMFQQSHSGLGSNQTSLLPAPSAFQQPPPPYQSPATILPRLDAQYSRYGPPPSPFQHHRSGSNASQGPGQTLSPRQVDHNLPPSSSLPHPSQTHQLPPPQPSAQPQQQQQQQQQSALPPTLQPIHTPRHNSLPLPSGPSIRTHPGQKLGHTPLLPRQPEIIHRRGGTPMRFSPPPPPAASGETGTSTSAGTRKESAASDGGSSNNNGGATTSVFGVREPASASVGQVLRWQAPKQFGPRPAPPPPAPPPQPQQQQQQPQPPPPQSQTTTDQGERARSGSLSGAAWPGFGGKKGNTPLPPPPPPPPAG